MQGITAVQGLSVGHATDADAHTGCTVLVGPFIAACDVRGFATGTRELETLSPYHLVGRADAILLTGGSAFGLAAADGVVAWLEERGFGFDVGVARVPIVPAAVVFDLSVGRPDRRPDAAMGRAACEAAGTGPVAEGRVGAGAGATVGKILGIERSMPGGLGSFAFEALGYSVGALVVLNPFGDVLDARGGILAGARTADGDFADTARLLRTGAAPLDDPRLGRRLAAGANTTLSVVATDAPISRSALQTVARAAATAVARRVSPVHTPFDGDVTFAISTAADVRPLALGEVVALGVAAGHALEQAIERAVTVGA